MFCVCVMVEVEITSTCPTLSADRMQGFRASAVSCDVVLGESKMATVG